MYFFRANHARRWSKVVAFGLLATSIATTFPTYAHADDDVTTLATSLANVGYKVHNDATFSVLAAPLLQIVESSSFDWNQALFGTDQLSDNQTATKGLLLGDITQFAQFTATTEPQAETLINDVIAKLQSLNSSITRADAIAFLTDLQNGALNNMLSVAHNQSAVQGALYSAVSQADASKPAIQALFASPALGGGAPGGSDSTGTFADIIQTAHVDASGATISNTTGNSSIQVVVPANAFANAQDITLATTDLSSLTATPVGFKSVAAVGVHFSDATPSVPVTLTITNEGIQSNAKVYKLANGQWTQVKAVVTQGKVTISFSSDPDFVIVNPIKLAANQRAIYLNGKQIAVVPGTVKNSTVYMPVWYVMNALNKVGFTNKWDGKHWYLTAPSGSTPNLKDIKVGTGAKGIYLNNTLVQKIDSEAFKDPSTGNPTTYMPMWYVMQALKRANVQYTWDGTNWDLITK